jgi:hypothetical protein
MIPLLSQIFEIFPEVGKLLHYELVVLHGVYGKEIPQ